MEKEKKENLEESEELSNSHTVLSQETMNDNETCLVIEPLGAEETLPEEENPTEETLPEEENPTEETLPEEENHTEETLPEEENHTEETLPEEENHTEENIIAVQEEDDQSGEQVYAYLDTRNAIFLPNPYLQGTNQIFIQNEDGNQIIVMVSEGGQLSEQSFDQSPVIQQGVVLETVPTTIEDNESGIHCDSNTEQVLISNVTFESPNEDCSVVSPDNEQRVSQVWQTRDNEPENTTQMVFLPTQSILSSSQTIDDDSRQRKVLQLVRVPIDSTNHNTSILSSESLDNSRSMSEGSVIVTKHSSEVESPVPSLNNHENRTVEGTNQFADEETGDIVLPESESESNVLARYPLYSSSRTIDNAVSVIHSSSSYNSLTGNNFSSAGAELEDDRISYNRSDSRPSNSYAENSLPVQGFNLAFENKSSIEEDSDTMSSQTSGLDLTKNSKIVYSAPVDNTIRHCEELKCTPESPKEERVDEDSNLSVGHISSKSSSVIVALDDESKETVEPQNDASLGNDDSSTAEVDMDASDLEKTSDELFIHCDEKDSSLPHESIEKELELDSVKADGAKSKSENITQLRNDVCDSQNINIISKDFASKNISLVREKKIKYPTPRECMLPKKKFRIQPDIEKEIADICGSVPSFQHDIIKKVSSDSCLAKFKKDIRDLNKDFTEEINKSHQSEKCSTLSEKNGSKLSFHEALKTMTTHSDDNTMMIVQKSKSALNSTQHTFKEENSVSHKSNTDGEYKINNGVDKNCFILKTTRNSDSKQMNEKKLTQEKSKLDDFDLLPEEKLVEHPKKIYTSRRKKQSFFMDDVLSSEKIPLEIFSSGSEIIKCQDNLNNQDPAREGWQSAEKLASEVLDNKIIEDIHTNQDPGKRDELNPEKLSNELFSGSEVMNSQEVPNSQKEMKEELNTPKLSSKVFSSCSEMSDSQNVPNSQDETKEEELKAENLSSEILLNKSEIMDCQNVFSSQNRAKEDDVSTEKLCEILSSNDEKMDIQDIPDYQNEAKEGELNIEKLPSEICSNSNEIMDCQDVSNSRETAKEVLSEKEIPEPIDDDDFISPLKIKVSANYTRKRKSMPPVVREIRTRSLRPRLSVNNDVIENEKKEDSELDSILKDTEDDSNIEEIHWAVTLLQTSFQSPSISETLPPISSTKKKFGTRSKKEKSESTSEAQWEKFMKSSSPKKIKSSEKKIREKVKKQVRTLCKSEKFNSQLFDGSSKELSKKKKVSKALQKSSKVKNVKPSSKNFSKSRRTSKSDSAKSQINSSVNKSVVKYPDDRQSSINSNDNSSDNKKDYNCLNCSFSTSKLNNIISHTKYCVNKEPLGKVINYTAQDMDRRQRIRGEEDVDTISNKDRQRIRGEDVDTISNKDRQRIRGEDVDTISNKDRQGIRGEDVDTISKDQQRIRGEDVDIISNKDRHKSYISNGSVEHDASEPSCSSTPLEYTIDDSDDDTDQEEGIHTKFGCFKEKAAVWVQNQGRFWPAVIRTIKKGKVFVFLITSSFTYEKLKVSANQLRTFDDSKMTNRFLKEANNFSDKDDYIKGVQKCQSYLNKVFINGRKGVDMMTFFQIPDYDDFSDSDSECKKKQKMLEEHIYLDPDTSSEEDIGKHYLSLKPKAVANYILEKVLDDRLLSIYSEEIPNENHKKFFNKSHADRLKSQQTFGPYHKDFSMDKIFNHLEELFQSRIGDEPYKIPYIFEVWIPEVLTKALSAVKNISLEEAETIFYNIKVDSKAKAENEIYKKKLFK